MGFALSSIQLSSSAFKPAMAIPSKHSGEGVDVSPHLVWRDAPQGTSAFAIICHDPDAPLVSTSGNYGFVHWVYYNITPDVSELAEASSEFTNGITDFGNQEYGGPMPPQGHGQHNYYFWIIALGTSRQFQAGLTMVEFLAQAEPDIIGMNRLTGTYERS